MWAAWSLISILCNLMPPWEPGTVPLLGVGTDGSWQSTPDGTWHLHMPPPSSPTRPRQAFLPTPVQLSHPPAPRSPSTPTHSCLAPLPTPAQRPTRPHPAQHPPQPLRYWVVRQEEGSLGEPRPWGCTLGCGRPPPRAHSVQGTPGICSQAMPWSLSTTPTAQAWPPWGSHGAPGCEDKQGGSMSLTSAGHGLGLGQPPRTPP